MEPITQAAISQAGTTLLYLAVISCVTIALIMVLVSAWIVLKSQQSIRRLTETVSLYRLARTGDLRERLAAIREIRKQPDNPPRVIEEGEKKPVKKTTFTDRWP